MVQINDNYKKLQAGYLFVEINRRITAHSPKKELIKLGIGDVVLPLSPTVVKAFHEGVDEMSRADTFKGYGPEQGYAFLREAIAQNDFAERGCPISADDIFVSDGAKCDTGNFQELFSDDVSIAVPDPVYPVYVDTNVMAGRTGAFSNGRYEGLVYLEGRPENAFVPMPEIMDSQEADIVYLCFPNNPTGVVASREQLTQWVNWALQNKSIILFDAAYEAFISDKTIPKSIYEIPNAEKCAVEFRSFSKTAGFTGVRCAYTVVPKSLKINSIPIRDFWNRRQSTKFNGTSWPVQKAAAAVYSSQGKKEVQSTINYYMANAAIILEAMRKVGFDTWGGENSPYVWVRTGKDSWATFDMLLKEADVVVTPGSGFGLMGEGFIRISAFNHREKVEEAVARITAALN